MCDVIDIVNYEGPNVQAGGMQDYRPVSTFSFLGRYRLVDFPTFNLSSPGVNHIKALVKTSPGSLLEYLGTGHHYSINSKYGELHILSTKSMNENDFCSNDISSYMYNMQAIEDANYPYVVLIPSYFTLRQDFSTLLDTHIGNDADITILYQNVDNAKESFVDCDVVNLNEQRGVLSLEKNRGNSKSGMISLETYILSKELFMDLVKEATNTPPLYQFRDIVNDECTGLDIRDVAHRNFVACINDFKSYYSVNMGLPDHGKAVDLFHADWLAYTRISDSRPTQYYTGVSMKNSMVSNGRLVEGGIKSSVIGCGTTIKKGTVVKNCVTLPGAMIGEDVHIENVVMDKKIRTVRKKELLGLIDIPLYMKRNDKI